MVHRFRVQGSGLLGSWVHYAWVQGSGSCVLGAGHHPKPFHGCRVQGPVSWVQGITPNHFMGSGFRVQGLGIRVQGAGHHPKPRGLPPAQGRLGTTQYMGGVQGGGVRGQGSGWRAGQVPHLERKGWKRVGGKKGLPPPKNPNPKPKEGLPKKTQTLNL